jgi:hypothetical protein
MWFVIILFGILCVTVIVLGFLGRRRDLAKMKSEMPELPPVPGSTEWTTELLKQRDDRIMEVINGDQDGIQRS